MADLRTTDPTPNTMNLSYIKADANELAGKQRRTQRLIDNFNAEIDQKGPNFTLEKQLKTWTDTQRSVCIRLEIAISVIGLAIDDLTQTSRDQPSILAIKDLLESMDYLDEESSLETMRSARVSVDQVTEDSVSYVLDDLEAAVIVSSDEHISRVTKILEATQLAVRELLKEPSSRKWDLDSHRTRALKLSRESGTSASLLASHNLERVSGREEVNEVILKLEKEVKELESLIPRVQALEDLLRIQKEGGTGDKDKENEKPLQTKPLSQSHKRSSSSSEDKADLKRRCL